MSTFETYILDQAHLHPAFAPQDAIKLCYQATFGAEHLLQEAASVRAYFEKEYAETPEADLPLFETICSDFGRVNLAAWKFHHLPADWLFQIFYLTASVPSNHTAEDLYARFNTVSALCQKGRLPFSDGNWKEKVNIYMDDNKEAKRPAAVHHSNAYRTSEKPAYRIVHTQYLKLIPLLQSIAALPAKTNSQATILTLDGRAASGKSTLAEKLTAILQAGLIHMDDFFLPPAKRSPQRFAEAGGNVDYERFADEVLPHLPNAESFSYVCFDCSQMALGEPRMVAASPYRIVEGSYSNHPSFGNYADFKILCDIDSDTQMQRILHRNGAELAEMFRSRWITMEEAYFDAYQIREKVDQIWETK